MKKPNAKSSREAIVKWIKAHWRNTQWGLMDCDRCPFRTCDYPCDQCGRWDGDLIPSFKRRNK